MSTSTAAQFHLKTAWRSALAEKRRVSTALLGQAFIAVGALVGARLLTSFASPEAVGEYNLILGITALIDGVLIRPCTQFAMRAYHDLKPLDDRPSFVYE